jgi:hypothetical protein
MPIFEAIDPGNGKPFGTSEYQGRGRLKFKWSGKSSPSDDDIEKLFQQRDQISREKVNKAGKLPDNIGTRLMNFWEESPIGKGIKASQASPYLPNLHNIALASSGIEKLISGKDYYKGENAVAAKKQLGELLADSDPELYKKKMAEFDKPPEYPRVRGLVDSVEGGMGLATPLALRQLILKPLKTGASLALGLGASALTDKGLENIDIPSETKDLSSLAAGLITGGLNEEFFNPKKIKTSYDSLKSKLTKSNENIKNIPEPIGHEDVVKSGEPKPEIKTIEETNNLVKIKPKKVKKLVDIKNVEPEDIKNVEPENIPEPIGHEDVVKNAKKIETINKVTEPSEVKIQSKPAVKKPSEIKPKIKSVIKTDESPVIETDEPPVKTEKVEKIIKAKPVVKKPSEVTTAVKPVETKPVETKPVETKPVETKPVETKPVETKPVETKIKNETKPVETKIKNETKPVETKPVKINPIIKKPSEVKIKNETKPVETKPVETKPVETKLDLQRKFAEAAGIDLNEPSKNVDKSNDVYEAAKEKSRVNWAKKTAVILKQNNISETDIDAMTEESWKLLKDNFKITDPSPEKIVHLKRELKLLDIANEDDPKITPSNEAVKPEALGTPKSKVKGSEGLAKPSTPKPEVEAPAISELEPKNKKIEVKKVNPPNKKIREIKAEVKNENKPEVKNELKNEKKIKEKTEEKTEKKPVEASKYEEKINDIYSLPKEEVVNHIPELLEHVKNENKSIRLFKDDLRDLGFSDEEIDEHVSKVHKNFDADIDEIEDCE